MRVASKVVRGVRRAVLALAVIVLPLAVALPSGAQMHGPPTWTGIGGHPLAPAPSVTSVGGPHLPPPLPSVTSIPNFGNTSRGLSPYGYVPHYNGRFRGRRGYGYGYGGLTYAMPYYIPADAYGDGYDYVGGPPLYSGPPMTNDSTLHIIVEQPPAKAYRESDQMQTSEATGPARQEPPAPPHEVKPGEPTVLVFRDGHQQEVSNYAIMGQTVWVFDKRTQKIALTDLDVPATIKANDDRGLSFSVPVQKPAAKKALELQPKNAPDSQSKPAPNVASVLP